MPQERPTAFEREQHGQTVVLVALLFVLLVAFLGLAVDGGRFYMERRWLQNAVDAGALACAQKLSAGGTLADAEAAGLDTLTSYNLLADPTGSGVSVPLADVFTTWFNASGSLDKRNLAEGIVAANTNCRVALVAELRTFFIGIVNPGLATIEVPANAHASMKGGMLPIVVNRFDDPPGPGGNFHDYSREEANDMNCDDNDGDGDEGLCPTASLANKGRERVVLGNGYTSTDSDFRGFIALDVRNFQTVGYRQYYNGADGMNANQLKDQEASYANGGYPGPDLIAYIPGSNPAQSDLQIGVMSGNSTGLIVDNMKLYFDPGDKIMVQMFDGQVREVPDFTINQPTPVNVTSPQANGNGPSFRVGANQTFRSANNVVKLEMLTDTFNGGVGNDTPAQLHGPTLQPDQFRFDPGSTSPYNAACPNSGPGGFSGGCFTPSGGSGTTVQTKDVEVDAGLASGIYSLRFKGTGYEPDGDLVSTKTVWVPLNVGGVTRDYTMDFTSGAVIDVTAAGDNAVFTFEVSSGNGAAAWNGSSPANNVTFALEYNSCLPTQVEAVPTTYPTDPIVCVNVATLTPSNTALPSRSNPPVRTLTVNTTGMSPGRIYTMTLRGRGINGDGQPVVHVQQLTINVAVAAGAGKKYVNVQGYAVFEIVTCTVTNDSNAICGKAVTGKVDDPTDPALAIGRRAGLVPWSAAPY